MNYKTFFRGKKIAVVGLGPHGEMVADIKFILRNGAQVSFYDMRSEARLQGFLPSLSKSGLIGYTLGKVPEDELVQAELIILSPEVSQKSLFLKKARQAGIRIEFANILFLKLAPAITLVGVMGACGKSTVAQILYGMLKRSFSEYEDQGLFLVDPGLPNGALTHLKKIKAGDVVLSRIPEEMMAEFHEARISPHVAVITSLTSSGNKEIGKSFAILEYQTYNNFIIAPDIVVDAIKAWPEFASKAKILRTKPQNSALATQAAELFKVTSEISNKVIEEFSGLKGHGELVKKVAGMEFYNDAASVAPLATLSALRNLSINKNIVLIFGGAYTGYDYDELTRSLPEFISTIILLPGSGSLGLRREIEALPDIRFFQAPTIEEAVTLAREYGKKGDRVLFSPGCEAIGIYISRRERGEKFVKAVRGL